jgi:acyl-CoA synthetase (AMP-forming)/AMP-acid ligase II
MIEHTWWTALEAATERHGEDRAAFHFEGPTWQATLTFGQWRRTAQTVSAGLAALGVEQGDFVGAVAPGSPVWPILQTACSRLGAILVPINSRYRRDELTHVLKTTRPRVVLTVEVVHTTPMLELVRGAADDAGVEPRIVVLGSPDIALEARPSGTALRDHPIRWEAFLAVAEAAPLPNPTGAPTDPVLVQFTSGSTAFPKAALLNNGGSLAATYHLTERMGLTPADRFFSTQPFYHVGGSVATTLVPLTQGATMVVPERYTAEETFRLIAKYQCTARTGQAAMYWMELAHPDFSPDIFATVTKGWAGGTHELKRRIAEEMGIDGLTSVYGLTETCASTTVAPHDAPAHIRLATNGPALPGLEVGVMVDGEVVVEPGVAGEICVRGWSLMVGYHGDPEATAATIDADGWLHTGDLGQLDPDGNLLVVDRIKDMIKPGGENVSPAEVERVIETLDGVVQVAVVGMPDERLGEVPVAFVELRADSGLDEASIIKACRPLMASFKVPRRVVEVTEWPMTESGKIQRHVLKARLAGSGESLIGATG